MGKKILILGSTGKMGLALADAFKDGYRVVGKNSKDFNAEHHDEVSRLISDEAPDVVINTAAFLGIDPCEEDPQKALRINTLYPKLLAELSREKKFLLIHFSTDAVFNDDKGDYYTEDDKPQPLNVYGLTKFGGDCLVQALADTYYIFRLPIIFGGTLKNTQFVEKMLQKVATGQKVLRISGDIVSSPTYSRDAAAAIRHIVDKNSKFGLYHVANAGKASLYELMGEIVKCIGLDTEVEKASYKDFPFVGIKNTYTPITSKKTVSLRPWKDAVKDYCATIRHIYR